MEKGVSLACARLASRAFRFRRLSFEPEAHQPLAEVTFFLWRQRKNYDAIHLHKIQENLIEAAVALAARYH